MKISTKGRYALIIMTELARNYKNDTYLSLNDIAKEENISLKNLEKIMNNLKKKDYFITSRGGNGGYKLAYSPDKYIIGDIIRASEEQIDVVPCINEECSRSNKCSTFPLWKELNDLINDYLDSKTLADYI